MFKYLKISLATILIGFNLMAYSQADKLNNLDAKNGFNDLKFRTSLEDVKKLVGLKKITEVKVKDGKFEYYNIKKAELRYTFGKYKIRSINIGFYNSSLVKTNILSYIEVNLVDSKDISDSRLLNDMLILEYGQPTKTEGKDESLELRQDGIAYTFDWRANNVHLRLLKWDTPVNQRFEFRGNTYKYYDVGIYNAVENRQNDGF